MKPFLQRFLAALVTLLLAAAPASAGEPERVLAFSVDLTIDAAGAMTVVESIGVHTEGKQIVHGIIRTLPTGYHDASGKPAQLKITDVVVARDGYADAVRITEGKDSIDIRIGKDDVKLGNGDHVYTISYKVMGAVATLPAGHQLAWNVTGNDWDFPIESAAARVYLPGGAKATHLKASTGKLGTNTNQATITEPAPGHVVASMPKTLNPGEGLTIFVDWPKAP